MPDPVFRFATVRGQNIHWFLKRTCSATPAQLGWLYALLCAVLLVIAALFWFQGAILVLPFAWVARHATDGETGRYLRPELRPVLAQEIRRALRSAQEA